MLPSVAEHVVVALPPVDPSPKTSRPGSSIASRAIGPLPPDEPGINVVILPRPFATGERIIGRVPVGWSIQDIIDHAGIAEVYQPILRVWLNETPVPRQYWRLVRPKKDTLVGIRPVPRGGGGGGKSPLRIVLSIAVMVAAAWAAPAVAGWAAAQAAMAGVTTLAGSMAVYGIAYGVTALAITMVGNALINAIAPPPTPAGLDGLTLGGSALSSPKAQITGTSNRANPGGPIPVIFGRRRLFPALGARAYTETIGNQRYFRMLFILGFGPLQIEDLRIGDTPISAFQDVEYEVRQGYPDDAPVTLFPKQIREESLTILLTAAASSSTKNVNLSLAAADGWREAMSDPADFIDINIYFPNGLGSAESGHFASDDYGGQIWIVDSPAVTRTVVIAAELAPDGTPDWAAITFISGTGGASVASGTITVSAATGSAFTAMARLSLYVPSKRKIRLRRNTDAHGTTCTWKSNTSTNYNWQQRTTRPDCDEISADFNCSMGLTYYNSAGGRDARTVQVQVQYSVAGLNVWQYPTWVETGAHLGANGVITITDNSTSSVARGGRWKVANGQYDVRFRRLTADTTDSRTVDKVYASALRSISIEDPIKATGLSKIALRIREGGQINGIVQQFNCVATAILPDWDVDTQTWITRATRSPAAAYRTVLCGPGNERPVDPSTRLHLTSLQDWAEACAVDSPQGDGPMWTFDAVADGRSTVFQMLREIAASGRANFAMPDGKFGVVRDVAQNTPVQNFSPRNSWGYRGRKTFVRVPHGVKIKFVNDTFWEEDEIPVYADGYDENTATLFEVIDLMACTREAQAWREGRYQLAVGQLRPETHELYTDIENLRCTVGDLVMLSHDVAMIGLASGRVKSLTIDEDGKVAAVVIDELVAMTTSKTYGARFRARNAANIVVGIQAIDGETKTLAFLTPLPQAQAPVKGDLVQFGETDLEAAPMIVKAIQRGPDFTAKLILLDAAQEVHEADRAPIPAYNPRITRSTTITAETPSKPKVASVRSDESVLTRLPNGTLVTKVLITLQPPTAGGVLPEEIEGQYREIGARDWKGSSIAPASGLEVSLNGVEEQVVYDLRVRYRTGSSASDWTYVNAHTVVGKSTKPGAPTSLLVERLPDDTIRYRWTHVPPIDHWGYRLKWNYGVDDSWGRATPAHDINAPISVNWFETKAFSARTFTVMVKAVDEGGNESEDAALAIVNLGDAIPLLVKDTTDFGALSWPGEITGGTVNAGIIEANPAGVLFTDPSQPLYTNPNQDLFSTFEELVLDLDWRPSRRGFLRLTLDADGPAIVEYRTVGAAPLYTNPNQPLYTDPNASLLILGPYVEYLGPMEVKADILYQIRVTIPGGGAQGVIRALVADIELPTDTESQHDVPISAGGVRVTPIRSWEDIVNVNITVQEAPGYDAIRVALVDKDPVLGPLLRGYDAAGNPADALVDVTLQGIPAV